MYGQAIGASQSPAARDADEELRERCLQSSIHQSMNGAPGEWEKVIERAEAYYNYIKHGGKQAQTGAALSRAMTA